MVVCAFVHVCSVLYHFPMFVESVSRKILLPAVCAHLNKIALFLA